MIIAKNFVPIKDKIYVTDLYFGEQKTTNGIIIIDDDGTDRGIHPRWGKVYAIGPDSKEDIEVGDWILIAHGRWSRVFEMKLIRDDNSIEELKMRLIDPKDILLKANGDIDPKKFVAIN